MYVTVSMLMMKKVAFLLKPEQLAKLRAIQKELGVPVSESIRRSIDQYLKRGGKKK
jgi:Ribbon-helix-helix domain